MSVEEIIQSFTNGQLAVGKVMEQAECQHDRVDSEIVDVTTRGGHQEERIIKVRVYTCLDCQLEWED